MGSSNNYSIKLGIKLDESALANINSELNNKLKNKNVNISIDAKNLEQIKDLLNNIYLELGRIEKKNGFSSATKSAKQFNTELEKTTKHIKNQSFATDNWAYNWSKAMQSFLTYNTVTQFFNTVMNGIKDMIEQVKDLDKSLVELQKVTDLEGESLKKFVKEAYDAGETVAKTGTEMIEAATSFAKAGYKDTALQLGTIAAMYTNIADEEVNAATAADAIIAQMKAFNIEAQDSIHIIDAINEVSNNFAVSSADITRNLGKASAVMANAGNSMEQYIGLMTAATEVTRNASKAANGLKTLTLRLQGMNDEGEKDLEIQAQMEGLFNKLGISVYKANGELKNTYEILETLAPIYKELTNAEKAYVTETIAGKYQAQNAAAILNNWATAVSATETAMNSAGSAANENEKVLNSIEGHIQRLASTWEEFSQNIISSDLIKFFVDFGNVILKVANSGFGRFVIQTMAIVAAMGLLKSAYTGVVTKLNQMTVGLSKNSIALVLNTTNLNKQDKSLQKTIKKILSSKGAYDKETKSISADTIAEIKNAMSKEGVSKAEQNKILKQITSKKITEQLTGATIAQTVAQEALNAAMTMGISFLISGAVSLISGMINASKETAEAAAEAEENLRDKAIETADELNDRNKSLDEYINQYKNLKKELDDEKTGYARSAEIRSEIVDLQKEINNLLGDENNGIDLINDSLDETIRKQNELKKSSAKDYMSKNAAAVSKAEKNLKKNYYDKDRNKIMAEEWNFGGDNIGDERWENITDAMYKAMGYQYSGDYGWGGKNDSHHGFDKEYYYDFSDDVNLTAQQAKELWAKATEDLQKNKKAYMEEFNLSEEDFDKVLTAANKNYTEVSEYIDKQNEVLNKAAESMIYADDTYFEKITELQVAQAEYNKAKTEGDEEAMKAAIDKIANLQDYVNGIDNDTVQNYFQNILNEWDKQIKQSKLGEKLGDYFKSQNEELQSKLKDLNMDGDTFKNLFNAYLGGDKKGLDSDTIKIFDELKSLMDELGISAEDLQSYMENLGYVFPGVAKKTKEAVDALSLMDDKLKQWNENVDSIQNAYKTLYDSIQEYNENGYITLDTLQNILNLDDRYIQYLIDENGQLSLNQQAFENMANARLDEAEALAVQQAMEEMNILTSQSDQVEIEKLRKKYADLETELGNTATKYLEVANAAAAFKAVEDVSQDDKDLADKILKNLDNKLAVINKARLGLGKNFNKSMGGSSSSKSSSKSQKEWWETALDDLKDQFNYSEITINEYINGLENLLGKVGKGTEAWRKINKELQKQKLDKVKDDYNAGRISLNQYIISLQNLQKAYKEGTDAWNDLAEAIKKAKLDALKNQQNDLKAALSAVNNELENQINNYEDLKDKAIDAIDAEIEKQEELRDTINDNIDDYERAQKAVLKYLNEELDSLNDNKNSIEDYYDAVTDALEDMNKEQEKAVNLAEAYEALVNAMTQKTKKVWREGLGWVWEADQEAIKEAQKAYDDLVKESQLDQIEKNKTQTIEALDEQINALEEYISSWESVLDKFENDKNQSLADLLLGENWSEAVSQLDPDVVNDFSNAYYNLQKSLEETEAELERLNQQKEAEEEYWDEIIQKVQDYKDQWADVANAYEEAANKQKANQLLMANWEKDILNQRIEVLEDFKNKYNAILSEIDKVTDMNTNNASNYTPYSLPGYAEGGEVDFTGLAMLHGSKSHPEYVLNNDQMRNLLSHLTKPQYSSNINSGSSIINNYNFGDIELPNVNNAQQFINELKSLVNTTKNL